MDLTQDQRQKVERNHALVLARSLVWGSMVEDLLDEFLDKKVPFIPVKGLVVSETLYPDPGARPFDDLDFLIPEEYLNVAEEVLVSMGYARFGKGQPRWSPPHTHHTIFCKPRCPPVELHFRLAHELACVADLDNFFRDSNVGLLRGRAIRLLNHEDQLVHLLTHAASHGLLCGALWALDVALLVIHHPDMDFERVATQLETRKLGPSGAAALHLASNLFPSIARDTAELRERLNRLFLCTAVEHLVGQHWWAPPPTGRSLRSLMARVFLHQSGKAAAQTLTSKIRLNLIERTGWLIPRDR